MREITCMPQEDLVAEKFTVHYGDGTVKDVSRGVFFAMDSDDYTLDSYVNVDNGGLIRTAVSALALCKRFGLISEVVDAIRTGTMERVLDEMEVVMDEEPV